MYILETTKKACHKKYVVLPVETNKQTKNPQRVTHTFTAFRFIQFQPWANRSSLDKTADNHTNKHLGKKNLVTGHEKPKEEPNVSWNRTHPILKGIVIF